MRTIPISGIIASWEASNESNVTPSSLRKSLDEAGGEPVLITINSPGGDVYEGLEMYSMIRNYKGRTETRVVSMAASMGSIVALAGDKKTAEKTAAYMIHNAWGVAIGSYLDMLEAAGYFEDVSIHLSKIYTDRTSVENKKVRKMMDETTWMYGEDLSDFGFEIVDSEGNTSLAENRMLAKSRYDAFLTAQSIHAAESRQSLKKAAASIVGFKTLPQNTVNPFRNSAALVDEPWSKSESETRWRRHAGVTDNNDLPNATYRKRFEWYDSNDQENFQAYKFPIFDFKESQGGEFVNVSAVRNGLARLENSDIPEDDKPRVRAILERYLAKFNESEDNDSIQPAPNAGKNNLEEKKTVKNLAELKAQYPDLYAEAVQAGVDQERDRVKAHITMGESAGALPLAVKNIKEGNDFNQTVSAEYMSEGLKNRDIQNRNEDDPPPVGGAGEDDDSDQAAYETKLQAKRGKKK